jgi:putative membrane protein
MKKLLITAILCAGAYGLTAQNDKSKDSDFATEAANGGLLEVKLGELAKSKGQSQDIRNLGTHMVTDHSKANEELKTLAAGRRMTLPTSLDKACQKKYDELSKKSGADFDKAYAKMMVEDHEKDVAKFKKEAEKGDDPEFKAWAAKTLPTLEHHLAMSREAHQKIKDAK